MSAKAFGLMLVVVVVLGGVAGGALFAFSGGDTEDPITAVATATPTSDLLNGAVASGSATPTPGTSIPTDGDRPPGGRQGLNIEPLAGTIGAIDPLGLTITSTETGAQTEIIVPPETPVRLSGTAGDTEALVPGAEIIAFLQRTTDGTISVTNITIGGLGGRLGGLGGGAGTFSGGTTTDGTEFNAVPGTITGVANGVLSLDTTDGPVDVTYADDTPVQLTIAFSDATDRLPIDSQVTVIGQRDEAGTYIPITIATGDLGGFGGLVGGRGAFGGGGGRRGQQGTGDGGFGGFQQGEVFIVP